MYLKVIKSECLKLRRSPMWLAFFVMPLIPALFGTVNYLNNLELLKSGAISAGHARAVLTLKTEKQQQEAAKKIIALSLSVRQAETLCKNMGKPPAPKKEPVFAVDYVAECEKNLSKHLGRGVKIVNGKRKGRFELEFYGEEDLQKLLDALMQLNAK